MKHFKYRVVADKNWHIIFETTNTIYKLEKF